jgi:HK97 family phage prohead protease
MSTETVETRSVSLADLEIRDDGEGGRTICGVCVPYDSPAQIVSRDGNYTEVFRSGAFAKTIQETLPSRVKLKSLHDDRAMPIGHAIALREDPTGLYGEFKVAKTARGEEALQLIKDGTLDSFSVEFVPMRSVRNKSGDTVERREAKLVDVAIVPRPAYEKAQILALRSEAVEDVEPGETTQPEPTMSVRELRLIAEQVRSTAPAVTPAEVRSHLT